MSEATVLPKVTVRREIDAAADELFAACSGSSMAFLNASCSVFMRDRRRRSRQPDARPAEA